ncbi:hypothetical protein GCM10007304_32510 [Rhodococcoides trifolii]|uniref:DUF222 domain-containing protein n=1 Tax=Rhodococcoides trifolii TaxID=908250 RepID=A0A917LE01_9NOCA|nr:HNH endonuclease signature motif containing protein [Rhodococcus trifolii]GGG15922.1 hypothetical protein GCM10007304_32510 [Rhodococcus trifolii]
MYLSASLLHAAVIDHHRGANAADAERIATFDAYYHARNADPGGSIPTHASIVSEIAAATNSTDAVVGGLLTLWWSMLPAVRAAFVAGHISLVIARVVKNHTADARTATLDRLESDIVCAAKALAPGPLGTEIDRLLTEADAEWDKRTRERAALTETSVRITKMPRGLRKVVAIVPAVDAAAIGQTVTDQIRRICNPDPTTVNYLRAQAFVAVMRGGQLYCNCGRPDCRNPAPAKRSAPFTAAADGTVTDPRDVVVCDAKPAAVQVRISCDLELILGIGSAGAQLDGYGPIDAHTCRALAANATWQALFLASRRYLDTLTGGDPYYGDDGPPPDRSPFASCRCRCGRPGCAAITLTDDQRQQHDIEQLAHHAENEEAKGYLDDTVTLGRSRPLAAATMPHPVPTAPTATTTATTRDNTAADVIAYWVRRFADGDIPPPSDGRGGFVSPPPGALTYAPSAALAALVRADHPTCIHTGCTVPSQRCDLDHTVEFDKRTPLRGGWTIRANLAPLCRRHHNHKTDKLWSHSRLPDGTFHLTDPLGHHYFTVPS